MVVLRSSLVVLTLTLIISGGLYSQLGNLLIRRTCCFFFKVFNFFSKFSIFFFKVFNFFFKIFNFFSKFSIFFQNFQFLIFFSKFSIFFQNFLFFSMTLQDSKKIIKISKYLYLWPLSCTETYKTNLHWGGNSWICRF